MASNDITGLIRGDGHTINVVLNKDITGSTVFFTVNQDSAPVDDSTAAIEKTITTFTDATTGTFTIVLDPVDTNSLDAGVYYYDIEVVDSAGGVTSVPKAKFEIVSDITRRTS